LHKTPHSETIVTLHLGVGLLLAQAKALEGTIQTGGWELKAIGGVIAMTNQLKPTQRSNPRLVWGKFGVLKRIILG
jgi:hypothetical protein